MSKHHRNVRKNSPVTVASRSVLLWCAFLVRLIGLEAQGLWRDEVDQWRFALLPLRDLVRNFSRAGWNGPLYSPLLRGWITVAGSSVFAMRLLSTFWGVLGVALTYVLAHRLVCTTFGAGVHNRRQARRAGAAAALLMASSPYMIWYAQEIKMYTWVPMLVLLALYALERACSRSRMAWWVVLLVAATFSFYSHILAALLIPVLVLWFLLHPRRERRAWLGGGVVLAALTLPYIPLLRWQSALALVPRETGYPDLSLGQMVTALLTGWSTGISQGTWATPGLLWTAIVLSGTLAVLGWGRFLLSRHLKTAVRIGVWLVLPLIAVWLVSLRGPIFTDRYLIWSAPAFYVLMAVGVGWVARKLGAAGWLLLVPVLVVNGHGWIAQTAGDIKPEFPAAVEAVAARREAGDLLLFQIPYNAHVFGFYAGDDLGAWAEAPFTNWRTPDGTYQIDEAYVAREMRRLVAGYDRVWLVYSEVALWDDRELVKAWLDERYILVDREPFAGVALYLYERPPRSSSP